MTFYNYVKYSLDSNAVRRHWKFIFNALDIDPFEKFLSKNITSQRVGELCLELSLSNFFFHQKSFHMTLELRLFRKAFHRLLTWLVCWILFRRIKSFMIVTLSHVRGFTTRRVSRGTGSCSAIERCRRGFRCLSCRRFRCLKWDYVECVRFVIWKSKKPEKPVELFLDHLLPVLHSM